VGPTLLLLIISHPSPLSSLPLFILLSVTLPSLLFFHSLLALAFRSTSSTFSPTSFPYPFFPPFLFLSFPSHPVLPVPNPCVSFASSPNLSHPPIPFSPFLCSSPHITALRFSFLLNRSISLSSHLPSLTLSLASLLLLSLPSGILFQQHLLI
jgi:hypothetical protein